MLDGVWLSGRPRKGDYSMIQPKARRVVPVLALTAALSLVPLADASAARTRTARSQPAGMSLLVQLMEQLASLWSSLQPPGWSDAGVRMDPNGAS
jgi:hypothetical protein